ncbi:MAG: right-handed parallel beta-helix repeat-containing protein [Planctomycetes bacterium]|nr:right-handed parallel beta-helix repeat-containing protein [Planctomycetota bacterium]
MNTPRALLCVLVLGSSFLCAQMSGLRTINPSLPSAGTNYADFASAVAALQSSGVNGPVVFEVYDDAGAFTAPMTFNTVNVVWTTTLPSIVAGANGTAVLVLADWAGSSALNTVTFRAAAGEHPVLDANGQSMGIFWNGADHTSVEGLEIRGAVYDAISIYSEAQHGQVINASVRRCRIHDCGGSGVVIYGNLPHPQNVLLESNFFWNLQQTNAGGFNTLARFGYVSWRRQNGLIIRGNTFAVTSAAGGLFAVLGSNPGSSNETAPISISDNIVIKYAAASRPILTLQDIGTQSGIPQVMDHNCWNDATGAPLAHSGPSGNVVSLNLNAWRSVSARELQSMDTDPQLIDPIQGNLHVAAGSAVIGAGTSGSSAMDIDGDVRDYAPDIGADEVTLGQLPAVQVLGAGSLNSSGAVALLSSPQLPTLGNTGFAMVLDQAPANTNAWVFASVGTAAQPVTIAAGCHVWLELQSMMILVQAGVAPLGPLPTSASGSTAFTLPLPQDPALAGLVLGMQAVMLDSGVANGFALSNALRLTLN